MILRRPEAPYPPSTPSFLLVQEETPLKLLTIDVMEE
jgi:hypothetical protein